MSPPPESRAPTAGSRAGFWVTLLAIFGCFVVFLIVLYLAYLPRRQAAPEVNLAKIPAQQRWMYTPQGRMQHLEEMRAQDEEAQTTYAWIDRSKGVVQLPIDRAMQLTIERIDAGRKP